MNINVNEIAVQQFDALEATDRQGFANLIAVLSQSAADSEQKIIALSPEDVVQKHMGLVALHEGEFVGYVAGNFPDIRGQVLLSKVGSLIVSPLYQGQGVGTHLVGQITDEVLARDMVPYAFCNPNSVIAFGENGYQEAQASQLPEGAVSPLGNKAMIYMGDIAG